MGRTVSELMSANISNAITNIQTWANLTINVKSYGAVGDGEADDTEAFQKAINYAISVGVNEIWIPPGTYRYTTLLNSTGITFVGDGVTLIGSTPLTLTNIASLKTETDEGLSSIRSEIVTTTKYVQKATRVAENFSEGLYNFDTTPGIEVNASDVMHITLSATKIHTNAAVFYGLENVRSFDVSFAAGTNVSRARIGFAKDTKDFAYVVLEDGRYYAVQRGVFNGTALFTGNADTLVDTDKVRATLHGQHMQIFVNDVLLGTYANESPTVMVPFENRAKAAIVWRDGTSTYDYGVTNMKMYQRSFEKIIHLSVDDVNPIMKEVTEDLPDSIFDHPAFAFLKKMHDEYSAVFSLYLWQVDNGWDINSMTTAYKNELRANSDWLRFGFHGYDENSNYGNGSIPAATAKTHYDNMMTAIVNFSSAYNIDNLPRIHFYSGDLATVRVWRDTNYGATGFLTAEDDRVSNMYLNATQRDALAKCDDFYDPVEQLFMVHTDIRLDNTGDIYNLLTSRRTDPAYRGQQNSLILFCHENNLSSPTVQTRIEEGCKFARDNGYFHAFPMDVNPKC